jgi:hypothetical protein
LQARAFKATTSRKSLANSKHDPTFGVPSENELAGARFQGHHVAQIASKLKA